MSNLLKTIDDNVFIDLYMYHKKESFEIVFVHVIPNFLFFLHMISPRTTSRMTTNTDVTEPAMVEALEVFVRGVLAKRFVDVVL